MRSFILAAALLASGAMAGEPVGLPHSAPVSATEVVICNGGDPQILTVIVTYKDGSVVRFNAEHMHGLSAEQLIAYAGQAPDAFTMGEKCGTSL